MDDTLSVGTQPTAVKLLSVVVVIVSDTTSAPDARHLAGCLQGLADQIDGPPLEIIVPYRPPVTGLDAVRRQFPGMIFAPFEDLKTPAGQGGSREHHDELRARGLALAHGELVALLEDHARPAPHWGAEVVKAHTEHYPTFAVVGGAIENGVDRPLNWAVYFSDFGRYQNPVAEGESAFASDANVSYKRASLEAIRPVWKAIFHETAVHEALLARGERLALTAGMVVTQQRAGLRLGEALRERYVWGRSYAATRGRLLGARRALYLVLAPLLPAVLTLRLARNALGKNRMTWTLMLALLLAALLTTAWALGEMAGYAASPRPASPPGGESIAMAPTWHP